MPHAQPRNAPSVYPSVAMSIGLLLLVGCGSQPLPRSFPGCDVARAEGGLPACVVTTAGVKSIEQEYIPGVLECELGPLTRAEAALDAQAIAARTYLLKHMLRRGPEAEVPITPRFQCWKPPKRARAFKSAERTVGVVVESNGEVINGNYVSGARQRDADCLPLPPRKNGYDYADWANMRALYVQARKARRRHPFKGTNWTEVLVTYNEGKREAAVIPSPIASRRPANRGALSQWGAICLAEAKGYSMEAILAYFYGDGIQLAQRAPVPSPRPEPVMVQTTDAPAGVLIETTRPISPSETAKPPADGSTETGNDAGSDDDAPASTPAKRDDATPLGGGTQPDQ